MYDLTGNIVLNLIYSVLHMSWQIIVALGQTSEVGKGNIHLGITTIKKNTHIKRKHYGTTQGSGECVVRL